MGQKQKHRVLVCALPEGQHIAHEILRRRYDYDICLTVWEACQLLDKEPDVIVCNLHFNDGRMFDFLTLARAHPHGRKTPVMIVQYRGSLTPMLIKSIKTASCMLGTQAFIEVFRWRQQFGDEVAYGKIREILDHLIQNKADADLLKGVPRDGGLSATSRV